MKRALPLLLSVAVCSATAFAEERSPIRKFLDEHPGATVHLRDGTGTPSLITGLAIEISAGAATPAIADLLAQWSDVLGYEPSLPPFEAPRVLGAAHATAYRFSQRHLGLPVLGADVAVSVSEAGHIFMVGNGLERIGRLPTGFDLSASAALRAAVDRLGLLRWSGKPRSVRQVIARVDGEWRATWEVRVYHSVSSEAGPEIISGVRASSIRMLSTSSTIA